MGVRGFAMALILAAASNSAVAAADELSGSNSPLHVYVGPGVLMSAGLGLSLELGIEAFGVLGRVSTAGAVLFDRSFTLNSAMAGYAYQIGSLAPYAGMGIGTVAWTPHLEIAEPQWTIHARSTAICPEVGVILGHDRRWMRMLVSAQMLIPVSTSLSSGEAIPASFRLNTSPWLLGAVRISL